MNQNISSLYIEYGKLLDEIKGDYIWLHENYPFLINNKLTDDCLSLITSKPYNKTGNIIYPSFDNVTSISNSLKNLIKTANEAPSKDWTRMGKKVELLFDIYDDINDNCNFMGELPDNVKNIIYNINEAFTVNKNIPYRKLESCGSSIDISKIDSSKIDSSKIDSSKIGSSGVGSSKKVWLEWQYALDYLLISEDDIDYYIDILSTYRNKCMNIINLDIPGRFRQKSDGPDSKKYLEAANRFKTQNYEI